MTDRYSGGDVSLVPMTRMMAYRTTMLPQYLHEPCQSEQRMSPRPSCVTPFNRYFQFGQEASGGTGDRR